MNKLVRLLPAALLACVLELPASAEPPPAHPAVVRAGLINPDAPYPESHASTIVRRQKQKAPHLRGFLFGDETAHYMCEIIASPKAEHFTSVAPSIRRAKS